MQEKIYRIYPISGEVILIYKFYSAPAPTLDIHVKVTGLETCFITDNCKTGQAVLSGNNVV